MTEISARRRYDFKRDLEAIENLRGMHTELISLYVPQSKQVSDAVAYLRNEASQASNIKSNQTRKNVQSALESLMSRLKQFKQAPENGVVLFVGSVVTGNNQQELQAHVLYPPEPIQTFMYRCDSRFYTEPLRDFLVEKEAYGILLIDRRECCVGVLRGKRVDAVYYDTSQVPGKHGRGGQSQRRFERLIEVAADDWFKRCGEKASDILLGVDGLVGILLGGPGPTKRYFYDGRFLDYRLQEKVIDLFDTGYTDEYGLRELVEKAEDVLSKLDLIKERRLMKQFMKEVQKLEAGLATYGEKQVREALQAGAVKTLLLSEGLRRYRANLRCLSCDHDMGVGTVKKDDLDKTPEDRCPNCNGRVGYKDAVDLVDELSELAEGAGGQVELLTQDSDEGETLLKAFGGVAALLRYAYAGSH